MNNPIITNYTMLHLLIQITRRSSAIADDIPIHDVSSGAIQSREVIWCALSPALLIKQQYMSGYGFISGDSILLRHHLRLASASALNCALSQG